MKTCEEHLRNALAIIDKLEQLKSLAEDIITHPAVSIESQVNKSLRCRIVDYWNAKTNVKYLDLLINGREKSEGK